MQILRGFALGFILSCLSCLSGPSSFAAPPTGVPARPKLTVVLVIDQFRADYLLRFADRFLPANGKGGEVGGFRYLMTQGAYFPMAEYSLMQSMTCPGHATILTGSLPYQNGISANTWNNVENGSFVYCAEDPKYLTIGTEKSAHAGTSPKNLIGTTVGDELKNAGLHSRVITLALKDRSAIMMGGHRADLALWVDKNAHQWVSSNYYLPDKKLPSWVEQLNTEISVSEKGKKIHWAPQGKGNGLSDESYRPVADTGHMGKAFPHELAADSKWVLALPYGMELTETAAERAIDAYELGRGKGTDVLAVSFSSHDYVGHAFGPNSRQMEEMTVAEDRLISRLLNHIRKRVPGGLKDVVIALTADHGIPPDPDYAKANRIDAGRISEVEMNEAVEKKLNARFGEPSKGAKWISQNHDFAIYVDRKTVAEKKAALPEVLSEIKEHLQKVPGVAHAFTYFDFLARRLPPGLHERQILAGYFPGRSGDVMIIPKPFWIPLDDSAVTHLTGYTYDRMVPLIISGARLKPGNYPQHARVIDLAPTLSYLLGILPPALSEGRVLHEAIR